MLVGIVLSQATMRNTNDETYTDKDFESEVRQAVNHFYQLRLKYDELILIIVEPEYDE